MVLYTVGTHIKNTYTEIRIWYNLDYTLHAQVNPPTRIERLIGITYEQKVKRAVESAQRICDEMNKIQETARLLND